MDEIVVTTGPQVDGHEIVRYLGVVRGLTVAAASWVWSGERAEWEHYDSLLREAFEKMVSEARAVGAEAIIGMRYSRDADEGHIRVLAYGTAVLVERKGG